MNHDVFVYGTLKTGGPLWWSHLHPRIGVLDSLKGFDVYDLGRFPATTPTEDTSRWAHGEVIRDVDDGLLARLDRIEGVPVLYQRVPLTTTGGRKVWAYVMTPEKVAQYNPRRIRSGRWTSPRITEGLADLVNRLVLESGKPERVADTIRENIRPLVQANGVAIPWRTGPMKTEGENVRTYQKYLERAVEAGI